MMNNRFQYFEIFQVTKILMNTNMNDNIVYNFYRNMEDKISTKYFSFGIRGKIYMKCIKHR